jgi:branched-subunit amino acid aminotransferase/4-amino-4-deoxychorismate lyase
MSPESTPSRALYGVTPSGPELLRDASDTDLGVHQLTADLPDGVYTALRTYYHRRFLMLEAHLDRLERNLAALGFGLPLDRVGLLRALDRLAGDYPLDDARVRIDALPAPPPGYATRATLLVALSPHEPVPEEFLAHGVGVRLTRTLRRESPEIKTTRFVLERRPLPLQTRESYEHVMVDERGRLLECTSANFYGVRGGALQTIPDRVLEGITREVVYRLAAELEVPVVAEPVTLASYAALDEAFLTSSTRGIVPIVRIEEAELAGGRPGPVTRRLMAALERFVEREARPASAW